jgi:hypothetical protein
MSIRRLPHLQGQFEEAGPAIIIAEDYLMRASTTPLDIASTLVHEGTHARIHGFHIGYRGPTAIRIERTCLREELRFLNQVTTEEAMELRKRIEFRLSRAEELWSTETRITRTDSALATVGTPRWLRRFYLWLGRDHAA